MSEIEQQLGLRKSSHGSLAKRSRHNSLGGPGQDTINEEEKEKRELFNSNDTSLDYSQLNRELDIGNSTRFAPPCHLKITC